MPHIRPVSDLRNNFAEISRIVHETGEPVFLTKNGYGDMAVSYTHLRRLRFLVYDNSTGKLMGLFGLGDPVFSLSARDQWIGWTKEDRRKRLVHVMDAFVLGAVPPYNQLLVGKLIAMLVASNEVREAYRLSLIHI